MALSLIRTANDGLDRSQTPGLFEIKDKDTIVFIVDYNYTITGRCVDLRREST